LGRRSVSLFQEVKKMFQKLEESSGRVIGFRLSGKLTDDDYKGFLPQLEEAIEEHGQIRLLWVLEDFHGWEPKAAWDDYKYGMKYKDDMERLAMVGENRWEEWMTKLAKPFMRGVEIKYYDHSQIQEAWGWLREGVES
jgi:hypothetical protein